MQRLSVGDGLVDVESQRLGQLVARGAAPRQRPPREHRLEPVEARLDRAPEVARGGPGGGRRRLLRRRRGHLDRVGAAEHERLVPAGPAVAARPRLHRVRDHRTVPGPRRRGARRPIGAPRLDPGAVRDLDVEVREGAARGPGAGPLDAGVRLGAAGAGGARARSGRLPAGRRGRRGRGRGAAEAVGGDGGRGGRRRGRGEHAATEHGRTRQIERLERLHQRRERPLRRGAGMCAPGPAGGGGRGGRGAPSLRGALLPARNTLR